MRRTAVFLLSLRTITMQAETLKTIKPSQATFCDRRN